jgi:hypothetical protein
MWHNLSGLKYHFEKSFKTLMDGFNIKTGASKKESKNTYQY